MRLNRIRNYFAVAIILFTTTIQATSFRQFIARCSAVQPTEINLKRAFQRFLTRNNITTLTLPNKTSLHPRLDTFAYKIKAGEVLQSTLALGQGLPKDCQKFLCEHAALEKKMNTGQLDIKRACRNLDRWSFSPSVLMNEATDSGARFLLVFVNATHELVVHRVRRTLKCHTNALGIIEWSYYLELPKVSEAEFSKRLEKLDQSTINQLTIEEASGLSNVLLKATEK